MHSSRLYAGVCFPGGVSTWSRGGGGVCLVGGCLPGPGGGGLPGSGGWCLPGPGGVSAWSQGVCLVRGGVSARSRGVVSAWSRQGLPGPGGFWDPSMHWGRHPSPCGQTDTCENITLATTSLRPVIIFRLACRFFCNLVAAVVGKITGLALQRLIPISFCYSPRLRTPKISISLNRKF